MRNFEFYEEEILKIAADGSSVACVEGKPAACDSILCSQCDFTEECRCGAELIEWLYAEHVEKPKISKKTKTFFEAIETGWVARDRDGRVCFYVSKPTKCNDFWSNTKNGGDWFNISVNHIYDFLDRDLGFIKWEDEEPWCVEDILKLEVEG